MRRFKTRINHEDLLDMQRQGRRRLFTKAESYRVKHELRRYSFN